MTAVRRSYAGSSAGGAHRPLHRIDGSDGERTRWLCGSGSRFAVPVDVPPAGAPLCSLCEARAAVPRQRAVYVAERDGLLKIGFSTDPAGRANFLKARLLKVIPGDRLLEGQLHRRFASYRERGEWFRPEGELAAWLAGVMNPRRDEGAPQGASTDTPTSPTARKSRPPDGTS